MASEPPLRIAPPPFLADPALQAVLDALPAARLVGGCVRDALAGRPVADVDLATPDAPDEVARRLEAAGLRAVPTGLAHGTVTAVSGHRGFEVTTLRRDVETDGRHARVSWTQDWQVDAARRDFTINAMSMTRDGRVHDYFGGIADLQAGRVRFVGDPSARIAEDALRVLRFFRFHARYGSGPPDAAALDALRDGAARIGRLSPERIWSELKRILAAPDPAGAVALMAELGVLAAVLPEGADPARLAALVAAGAPDEPLLRLAALFAGDPGALAARLRFSTEERTLLVGLAAGPAPHAGMDDAALRRLLADTPPRLAIGRAWLTGGPEALRRRVAAMPPPVFPLEGRDAVALGIAPGPAVGGLLRSVRAWWWEGGCVADLAACRAELARQAAG